MRLEQIRYLLHVSDTHSISKSAKMLSISQQGLSHSIHQLEQELNTKLLYRRGNQTLLTPMGAALMSSMRTMVQCQDQMHSLILTKELHMEQEQNPVCNVGITPQFCISAMPSVLKQMSVEHPELSLSITELEIRSLLQEEELSSQQLYFLTCPQRFIPKLLLKKGVLGFHEFARTEITALLSRSHPLSQRDSVTVEDLFHYPIALLGSELHFLRYVAGARFPQLHIRLYTTNFELYRAAVAMPDVISLTIPLVQDAINTRNMVQIPMETSETILVGHIQNTYTETFGIAQEMIHMMDREISRIWAKASTQG